MIAALVPATVAALLAAHPAATRPPPPIPPPPAPSEVRGEDDDPVEDDAWRGNTLLIMAGVMALTGTLANAGRAYVVSGPCQRDGQPGCTAGWLATSTFAAGFNTTSLVLAGVGGRVRGRRDATYDPVAHARRKQGTLIAGASLLTSGLVATVLIRSAWIIDYETPGDPQIFDFARPGHAVGYYGGLQLSSMAFAAGLALITYGRARPGRRTVSVAPTGTGLTLQGRF